MSDRDDAHSALRVVDLVQDAVATAASRPRPCELVLQGFADAAGREQISGQELPRRGGHSFGQVLGQ